MPQRSESEVGHYTYGYCGMFSPVNLSLERREEDFLGPEQEVEPHAQLPPGLHDARAGRLRRDQIVEKHFTC